MIILATQLIWIDGSTYHKVWFQQNSHVKAISSSIRFSRSLSKLGFIALLREVPGYIGFSEFAIESYSTCLFRD